MKAREILEVLDDMAGTELVSGFTCLTRDKWEKRLGEAVYSEISECLEYSNREGIEALSKSIASFVMGCYNKEVVELILRIMNTPYEHLVLESIERYKNS